jgi:phosphoribosyl 1,2-cyclic phosphodiesterase
LEYAVLYSGSSGNCSYIKEDDAILLIDAGVSCKKIKDGLAAHGLALAQVKGVLLTHEHTDHVVGLRQLVDRHGITLYTNEATLGAIAEKYRPTTMDAICFITDAFTHPSFSFNITGLPISHDVVAGRFYIFENEASKLVYITDTGYLPEKYYDAVRNANGYIIESNHEPELVLQSRYPWHIQQRILSDKGHLSNEACASVLQHVVGERTRFVTLAHLSEDNNRSDIAANRITSALAQINRREISVRVATKTNTSEQAITI